MPSAQKDIAQRRTAIPSKGGSTTMFKTFIRNYRRRSILKAVAKLRAMTVADIMSTYVITAKPEDEIIKAATKMVAEDISCLVITEEDKVVGILSERDFLRKVPLSKEVFSMKVAQIMTADVITVPPTTTLVDGVRIMKEHGFRRLVVLKDGKLVGIVTQTDFMKTLRSVFVAYPVIPELSISSIMTRKVLTVTPKESVNDAKHKMLKQDVGAIIITDGTKDAAPIGIMTEYDIVMQFYDRRGTLDVKEIGAFMRKYVRSMAPDASVFEANRLMLEKNNRRTLVMDGDKMAGIVTQTDLCRYVYTHLDIVEKAVGDPQAALKRFRGRKTPFVSEFKGEHIKMYRAA